MGILRTLLALSVVIAHTGATSVLMGGQIPVQMFYMISGFLISFILLKDKSYAKLSSFYKNRALRIFPVYWVVAALALVAYFFQGDKLAEFRAMRPTVQALLAFVNFALFGQDWIFFLTDSGRPPSSRRPFSASLSG